MQQFLAAGDSRTCLAGARRIPGQTFRGGLACRDSSGWTAAATRRSRNGRPATPASTEAAVAAFRAELDEGYFALVSLGSGSAEQVHELPLDADLVILRRPIAGG